MNKLLHIVDAKHIENYIVRLSFNNGMSAKVNLADKLSGAVFIPLKDVTYFKKLSIIGPTLAWENGADFAPEFLKGLAEEQGTLLSEAN